MLYVNNYKTTSHIQRGLTIRNHIDFYSKDLVGRLWTKTSVLRPYLRVKGEETCFFAKESQRTYDFLVNTVLRFNSSERKLETELKILINTAYFHKTDKSKIFTKNLLSIYSRKFLKRYKERENRFDVLMEEKINEAALNLLSSKALTENKEMEEFVELGYFLHLNTENNNKQRKMIDIRQYSAFMNYFYDAIIVEDDLARNQVKINC